MNGNGLTSYFAKNRALGYVLVGIVTWLGGQIVSPNARMQIIEAAQAKEKIDRVSGDSVSLMAVREVTAGLNAHLTWAQNRNDLLVSLVRLKCLENWDTAQKRQLLAAAGIPCNDLLGNRLPQR